MSNRPRTWAVLICAYSNDRWALLLESIDSVLGQSLPPDQVIVVVDHNQELLEQLSAHVDSRVRVISNGSTPGLSQARNTGVDAASTTHIAFLDDDARADSDWLEELDRTFHDPAVIGVGGGVVPAWEGSAPRWLPEEFWWVVGCSYRGLPGARQAIRNPIGANMGFDRNAMLKVSGFDGRLGRVGKYPAGCEETDLAIRMTSATSGTILHVPDARVFHTVPSERSTWSYFFRRCFAEGRSKAILAADLGWASATSSERSYVLRTLTSGLLHNLKTGFRRADAWALARAAALVGGLLVTTAGFLRARVGTALSASRVGPIDAAPTAPSDGP